MVGGRKGGKDDRNKEKGPTLPCNTSQQSHSLEKVFQLLKALAFYGTQRFITVFTASRTHPPNPNPD